LTASLGVPSPSSACFCCSSLLQFQRWQKTQLRTMQCCCHCSACFLQQETMVSFTCHKALKTQPHLTDTRNMCWASTGPAVTMSSKRTAFPSQLMLPLPSVCPGEMSEVTGEPVKYYAVALNRSSRGSCLYSTQSTRSTS
jgi:hypothetical protein